MENLNRCRPSRVIPQLLTGMLDTGIIPRGPGSWKNYLQIEQDLFDMILSKVGPLIEKQNTSFGMSISPAERLAVTLRLVG